MVSKNKKFLPVLILIFFVVGLYVVYSYKTKVPVKEEISNTTIDKTNNNPNVPKQNNGTYVLPATLQGMGITDVFDGRFYSISMDSVSTTEPGRRFVVSEVSIQMGNTQGGKVIVNDSSNTYKSLSKMGERSPEYIFYTKYDAKNQWYTIIKAGTVPNFFDP